MRRFSRLAKALRHTQRNGTKRARRCVQSAHARKSRGKESAAHAGGVRGEKGRAAAKRKSAQRGSSSAVAAPGKARRGSGGAVRSSASSAPSVCSVKRRAQARQRLNAVGSGVSKWGFSVRVQQKQNKMSRERQWRATRNILHLPSYLLLF